MTYEQFAISGVLAVALVGFVWGRWRYDVVAFGCLIAGVFLGVFQVKMRFPVLDIRRPSPSSRF